MRDPASTLVHQFKYRHVTRLACAWGAELGEWLRPGVSPIRIDLVLPVPLHPGRERERGFNQAALLARGAARAAGLPCVEDALRRSRFTATQTGLDAAGRRSNMAGAFLVWRPELIEGRAVALVDDVVTTGATLGGAVDALLDSGASLVTSVAVARA